MKGNKCYILIPYFLCQLPDVNHALVNINVVLATDLSNVVQKVSVSRAVRHPRLYLVTYFITYYIVTQHTLVQRADVLTVLSVSLCPSRVTRPLMTHQDSLKNKLETLCQVQFVFVFILYVCVCVCVCRGGGVGLCGANNPPPPPFFFTNSGCSLTFIYFLLPPLSAYLRMMKPQLFLVSSQFSPSAPLSNIRHPCSDGTKNIH